MITPTRIKLFLMTYFDAQPHHARISTPEKYPKISKYCKNSSTVTARGFAKHHKRLKADSKDQKTVFKNLSY